MKNLIIASILLFGIGPNDPIDVGFAGAEPFVVFDDDDSDDVQGIAPEVWREVAATQGIEEYEEHYYSTVEQALEAKLHGDIDVVVGPISITSSRELMYGPFTQPYFEAKMGIMGEHHESAWTKLKSFFSLGFLVGLFLFLLLIFGLGTIFWAVERKRNMHFDISWKGIIEGAWMAIVTMTTVGYGDKVPITNLGRVLTAAWMLVGILFFSTFTAFLTNALDSKDESFGHLSSKRVAVVEGSTGAEFARQRGAKLFVVDDLYDATEALDDGKVEGVVFDGPALQYYLKNHPDSPYKIHLYDESSENYGFVSNINVNADIIIMKEHGQIQKIKDRWLSDI